MDYIGLNRKVYDLTACEFARKKSLRSRSIESIISIIESNINLDNSLKVLELGPGNGQLSEKISNLGCDVTMVEFSKPMAMVAKENAPNAKLIIDDFLSYDFKDLSYDLIIGVAFIHLFPKEDCLNLLKKIKSLLSSEGKAFISTTKHDFSAEGLFAKKNFRTKPFRFRKRFRKEELENLIKDAGLSIIDYSENLDDEVKDRVWMSFLIK